MSKFFLIVFLTLTAAGASLAQTEKPVLLQSPTLSKTQIAFSWGGDIWIVSRDGGDAHRLVTGTGLERQPIFSPDGSLVAYTGDYDGNQDIYAQRLDATGNPLWPDNGVAKSPGWSA